MLLLVSILVKISSFFGCNVSEQILGKIVVQRINFIFANVVILSHRNAVNGNLSCLQLSALEDMHYSSMIRFDEAR